MEKEIVKKWQTLKKNHPLVHNITNFVVMNNTANALLSIGASPLMAHSHSEIEEIVGISNALVINIGTLDEYTAESMILAAHTANKLQKPWVLDPVGAGASTFRNTILEELLSLRPTVIRGNASEILALSSFQKTQGRGVDSINQSDEAIDAAKNISDLYKSIVCISGIRDFVIFKSEVYKIDNGHSMMAKVTGLGCSASAVIGAFIAEGRDPLVNALSGVALFSLAGELAAQKAEGPGTLQLYLYDVLYGLNEKHILEYLKISK